MFIGDTYPYVKSENGYINLVNGQNYPTLNIASDEEVQLFQWRRSERRPCDSLYFPGRLEMHYDLFTRRSDTRPITLTHVTKLASGEILNDNSQSKVTMCFANLIHGDRFTYQDCDMDVYIKTELIDIYLPEPAGHITYNATDITSGEHTYVPYDKLVTKILIEGKHYGD